MNKIIKNVFCALLPAFLVISSPSAHGEPPSSEALQQQEKIEEKSLEQALDALHDAMQALGKVGQLALDQQLPRLKEQTDKTLEGTQKLLNQWESWLKQTLEQHNKRSPEQQPEPENEHKPGPLLPSI